MADLFKKYGTDAEAEVDGKWEDMGDGLKVRVARWLNRKFLRRMEDLQRPYRYQIENGTLPRDKDEEIMTRLIAETILTGWEGLEIGGKAVPYSLNAAVDILNRPDLREFRDEVLRIARTNDRFRRADTEAEGKNSKPSSTGS
jgi:hypothetical protein